jgi:methionyl-tRNA formyltransferase
VTALRIAFAGTPDFAARHLAALIESEHEIAAVLTQPDRRAGRGKRSRPSAVKALAESQGLPVLQPETLKTPESIQTIAALKLDVLVVVAYGLLLPQAVLDLPRYGCLNVHGSLLPRWRGAAPIQRAVEAGDPQSGVTIMLMDAGLDTGPMLAFGPSPIPPLASSADLYERLAQIGPPLLLDVLADLPARLAAAQTQDDALATHAAKISKEEALLDWKRPAVTLARQIRAFNPAPGCYSFLDGQRIKIWQAQAAPVERQGHQHGEILRADDRGIAVCCKEGVLLLEQLQLPGAKAMGVSDILRGRGELFSPGQCFTNPDSVQRSDPTNA